MAKILVVVRGGLVEEVFSTRKDDEVTILDMDYEGYDPADLIKVVLPGSKEYAWSNPPWEGVEIMPWDGKLPIREINEAERRMF